MPSTMVHCSIVHLARHAKLACAFDQRSVEKMRRISWRSEIDRPKVLKEARRCQSVRKLLFSFARAPAKCGRNGPSYVHWRICFQQTPKVLRVRSSFRRTGEPTIWRQNGRARYENCYAWTDEGRVHVGYGKALTRSSHFRGAKLLAPALAPKVLLVRNSFGRAGKPVLSPSGVSVCSSCCVLCVKRALRGRRAYPPWSILLLFIWYAMRSIHVASIKEQSGYLTDHLRDF